MLKRLDQIPDIEPSEGHIVWGRAFQLDGNLFKGAEGGPLTFTPELVNLKDPAGNLLTLKLIFRITPTLTGPDSQVIDSIALGSFGQNDPLRMWYTSIFTAEILSIENYVSETKLTQTRVIYGEQALLDAEEVLYTCLNACFFAIQDDHYSETNIHSRAKWITPPEEIIAEIARRLESGEALNTQFLAMVIEKGAIPELSGNQFAEQITREANAEWAASTAHKMAIVGGEYPGKNPIYQILLGAIPQIDFAVEYNGVSVLDNSIIPFLEDSDLNLDIPLMSGVPIINFANLMITRIFQYIRMDYSGANPESNVLNFPLVGDHIRETIVRRIYDYLAANDLAEGMTLGRFASEVYQLGLNNTDPNMMKYLRKHDDSQERMKGFLAHQQNEG